MSNATELLSRALKFLDYRRIGSDTLEKDIKTFLAAEPEAEPVRNNAFDDEICPVCGYYCNGKGGFGCIDKPVLTGLRKTPRPEPARKPMTEMEVGEEILRNADEWSRNFANGFVLGVRFAEKHHGIGANKSDPDSIDLQSRCRGYKE